MGDFCHRLAVLGVFLTNSVPLDEPQPSYGLFHRLIRPLHGRYTANLELSLEDSLLFGEWPWTPSPSFFRDSEGQENPVDRYASN